MSNDWHQSPSDPNKPQSGPNEPLNEDSYWDEPAPAEVDEDEFWGNPDPGRYDAPEPDSFHSTPRQHDQPPITQRNANSSLENKDLLAIILALILPGSGQIILGQTTKGIILVVVSLFTCAGFGLIAIASLIDAYCVVKASKRRPVGEWEFFPDINDAF